MGISKNFCHRGEKASSPRRKIIVTAMKSDYHRGEKTFQTKRIPFNPPSFTSHKIQLITQKKLGGAAEFSKLFWYFFGISFGLH